MNNYPFKLEIVLGSIIIVLVVAMIFIHWKSRDRPTKAEADVDINDVIERVESSLRAGEKKRRADKLERLFEVKSFDLELNFLVKSSYSQGGKLETKFIAVSADSETTTEQTQKITLHMDVAQPISAEIKPKGSPIETPDPVTLTSEPPASKASLSPSPRK